ncbi:hypothetical protein ACFVQB_14700 [Paenibacillus sp. NPDC057886]|uniref:hypothetical protein n=1 Tax=Paenibacillus sp. NPDC057886 TaxID=3346270 RepID=UPI0036AC4C22
MMKRYYLFALEKNEAIGGLNDLKEIFNNIVDINKESLMELIDDVGFFDEFQILDTLTSDQYFYTSNDMRVNELDEEYINRYFVELYDWIESVISTNVVGIE